MMTNEVQTPTNATTNRCAKFLAYLSNNATSDLNAISDTRR